MITLQAWMEQHPGAVVVDARPGQVPGGKWVQAERIALRGLDHLSDYTVAYKGSNPSVNVTWLLKPRTGQGQREESVLREVSSLLEATPWDSSPERAALHGVADDVARLCCQEINRRVRDIPGTEMRYKAQYVLEETIKKLQEAV